MLIRQQKAAIKAAHLHLLSKIHSSGLLKEMLDLGVEKIDKQTMKEEVDAKIEVYNYAARFGLIPKFSLRKIRRPTRGRKNRVAVESTIQLPAQNIEAVARDYTVEAAEIAASIKFKEAAERYHAEHGDGSINIKDSTALNTDNAKQFLSFWKSKTKGATLDTEIQAAKGYGDCSAGLWAAQIIRKNAAPKDSDLLAILGASPSSASSDRLGEPVVMSSKKKAEMVAFLVAATELTQASSELLADFQRALSESGSSGILAPIRPLNMDVDGDAIMIMQETLRDSRRAGLPDEKDSLLAEEEIENRNEIPRFHSQRSLAPHEIQKKNEILRLRQKALEEASKSGDGPTSNRAALPMSQYRAEVLGLVNKHTYSVIVGATGSGKTTQVPQILLEEAIAQGQGATCNVVCTQPRRIAATSIGRRVAEERNEPLQNTVGYHVRFDAKKPQLGGSINYCTTGILLQQLQAAPDEVLDRTSHIVIDEVHERDILIDFLMIIVKRALIARRQAGKSIPKVILMSATIDSELFAKYFQDKASDGRVLPCPSLTVPGRTFPVTEKYLPTILEELAQAHGKQTASFSRRQDDTSDYLKLETSFRRSNPSIAHEHDAAEATIDWKRETGNSADRQLANEKEDSLVPIDLISVTIAHVVKTSLEGAILVFLPGYEEMRKVAESLRRSSPLGVDFTDDSKNKLYMLHSTVPAAQQQEVFRPSPGCRKIILSTNIAETSVTIPDIQYVIDTGKLREKRYDQVRRITKLQCTWISKSNAKQRAGRAGRVQNGNYLALFSRDRFESLRAIGLPEMLRSDLQEVCLDIRSQAFQTPIRPFLAQAIEPPSADAVDISVRSLQNLQALTRDEKLTPLGRLLASLPVHPSLGKMIVLGVIFRCLDPMIILGAALSERSLFVAPPERRREAQERHALFLEGTASDHFALVNAFTQMRLLNHRRGLSALRSFANENFLHHGAFLSIESVGKQIEEVLVDAGLIPRVVETDRFESEFGHPSLNKNSTNVTVIKSLALAGLHPNLAVCTGGPTHRTPSEKNALIHPSSLNYTKPSRTRRDDKTSESSLDMLYSFTTMAKSNDGNSIFLRDTSVSTPLMALLFGGRLRTNGNIIEMDGWLPFYVRAHNRGAKTIMEFRKALDRLLTGAFRDLAALRADRVSRKSHGSQNDWENGKGKEQMYLADDRVREIFSEGLVEVLNRDLRL